MKKFNLDKKNLLISIDRILKNSFFSDYPFGYVITDHGNNIVGFMGTIFSKRILSPTLKSSVN